MHTAKKKKFEPKGGVPPYVHIVGGQKKLLLDNGLAGEVCWCFKMARAIPTAMPGVETFIVLERWPCSKVVLTVVEGWPL